MRELACPNMDGIMSSGKTSLSRSPILEDWTEDGEAMEFVTFFARCGVNAARS
jgi:hypothetical protein